MHKAKLGRYQRLQQELEANECNRHKIFVQAGYEPLASVELNEIASTTHQINFPQCHHFC